ncbi:MAG: hypothetical protein IJE52_02635 [Bacteroidales bacterium]|nr:hypothetical protein [Bacteroidales bacterium]
MKSSKRKDIFKKNTNFGYVLMQHTSNTIVLKDYESFPWKCHRSNGAMANDQIYNYIEDFIAGVIT